MAIVGIDALEGRVLGRDLFAPNGRFILAKGAVVTGERLDTLRAWGVVEACVSDDGFPEGRRHVDGTDVKALESYFRHLSAGSVRGWFFDLTEEYGGECPLDVPAPDEVHSVSDLVPLEFLVSKEPGLVSYSPVLGQIIEVIESPRSSASHVAYVVERDSALSAKLLRLVNSPLYGFPRTVTSIEHAVAIVGSDELMSLAIQVASITYFSGIDGSVLDMRRFWEHSICCALFARLLAGRRFRGDDSFYFVGGMLLNLGRMIMMERMPESFCRALTSACGGRTAIDAEKEIFGYSSPQVTASVLSKWLLPPELAWSITEARLSPDCRDPGSMIFRLAESLASAFGYGFAGDYFVPSLDDGVIECLDVTKNELSFVLTQFNRQRSEIVDAFLGGIGR